MQPMWLWNIEVKLLWGAQTSSGVHSHSALEYYFDEQWAVHTGVFAEQRVDVEAAGQGSGQACQGPIKDRSLVRVLLSAEFAFSILSRTTNPNQPINVLIKKTNHLNPTKTESHSHHQGPNIVFH